MKKQLVIIGIVALLVCVGLSGCNQNVNNSDESKWHTIQTISGNIHNGTWFFAKEITPINLEKQEQFFSLVMYISIDNYCRNLTLKSFTDNNQIIENVVYPEKYGEQNGNYRIDFTIPVKGNTSDYPYDEYQGNITFITTDNNESIVNLNKITSDISLSGWHLKISGEVNKLNLTFNRNEEVRIYEILMKIGVITLVINVLSCLFSIILFYYFKRFDKFKGLESFLFHLGNVTIIPFTIGIIFNYIIYTIPQPLSYYAIILLVLMIISIVLGAIAFTCRERTIK